ncbi:hypothetical protein [Parasphingorhabdus pacifica]
MAGSSSSFPALPVSIVLFGMGLLATVAIFALYAAGYENLPVWLNVSTMLAPLGLIVGVVTLVVTARKR